MTDARCGDAESDGDGDGDGDGDSEADGDGDGDGEADREGDGDGAASSPNVSRILAFVMSSSVFAAAASSLTAAHWPQRPHVPTQPHLVTHGLEFVRHHSVHGSGGVSALLCADSFSFAWS